MMSTIHACRAREGSDAAARVYHGSLTLGRESHPYVDVVGSVSLVEGA